ncbi:MAG: deoxyribodipyrimidine photo-lyase [Candidatus Entotheonellia bacterium]
MSPSTSIVWFRQDLRLQDNPALTAAIQHGGPVIPVLMWSPFVGNISPLGEGTSSGCLSWRLGPWRGRRQVGGRARVHRPDPPHLRLQAIFGRSRKRLVCSGIR